MQRSMAPIGVIGGSGFLGERLVERLAACGRQVRVIDRRHSRRHPQLWRAADVRQEDVLARACEDCDVIYNLAAEHRDDVTPVSLYDQVNVEGAQVVCRVAEQVGARHLVFTSTVAVYGLPQGEVDESAPCQPFNAYGRSKLAAEGVYRRWQKESRERTLTIIRPTVIFGPGNRGNVYNLMRQIAAKRFALIGNGTNRKSLAYVDNVAAFLVHALNFGPGVHLYNYADKPDLSVRELVDVIGNQLGQASPTRMQLPYTLGYLAGAAFDAAAWVTRRKFPISRVRVRKFCANTQFASQRRDQTGFRPVVSLQDGLAAMIRSDFLRHSEEQESRRAA